MCLTKKIYVRFIDPLKSVEIILKQLNARCPAPIGFTVLDMWETHSIKRKQNIPNMSK